MTPLVDVMLVVLVLFLITSPLLWPGPEVTLPRVRSEVVRFDESNAVVTVKADGSVYYQKTRVDRDLSQILLADPVFLETKKLYVRGDHGAPFGDVERVLDVAHRLAASGVNLVVDPVAIGEEVP
jgi:biopolymer transport protein ExbD